MIASEQSGIQRYPLALTKYLCSSLVQSLFLYNLVSLGYYSNSNFMKPYKTSQRAIYNISTMSIICGFACCNNGKQRNTHNDTPALIVQEERKGELEVKRLSHRLSI